MLDLASQSVEHPRDLRSLDQQGLCDLARDVPQVAAKHEHVAALQGQDPADYSPGQMSYDLRRIRLKGLIHRLPASHRYLVTPAGRRIALFFSETYARVLRPGLARLDATPPIDAPDPLRAAWRSLDQALSKLVHDARLAA